jgi:protein phosphatase
VEVDLGRVAVEDGDILLLCCDGLSSMVPDAEMAEILGAGARDLKRTAQRLVDAANDAGGVDNITCVLAQVRA